MAAGEDGPSTLPALSAFSDLVCVLALATGGIVLAGWFLNAPSLEHLFFGTFAVGPQAAVTLILTGGALGCANRKSPQLRLAAQVLAGLAVILGIAELVEAALATNPGRVPLPMAIEYVLLGTALLLKGRGRSGIADILGVSTFLFLYFGLLYLAFQGQLIARSAEPQLDLQTWFVGMLLSAGVVGVQPSRGMVRMVRGGSASGIVLRRFLVVVLVTPPALGLAWVWGIRSGLVSTLERLTLTTVVVTTLLVALVVVDARRLDQIEAERRKAQGALATSQAELKKASELAQLKDAFLSTISHEMRTPLSLIMGYTELLEDTCPGSDLIAGIHDGSRRLAEQIDKIVDYSALLGGSLTLYRTPCDLAEIASEAVAAERERFEGKQLELGVEIDRGSAIVSGDSRRLAQVVKELLDNAYKATPEGRRVGIWVGRSDGVACLEVTDSGPGLSEAEMAQVWEAFGQVETQDAKRRGGLGLGLPIVKKLVELHGGSVSVSSVPDRGCTFSIRLPAGRAEIR